MRNPKYHVDLVRFNANIPATYKKKLYELAKSIEVDGGELVCKFVDNFEKIIMFDSGKHNKV